jgi:hypothetical protein
MFDTMIGEVAAAGREERLARAQRNTLLSAAEQASTGERTHRRIVYRERVARGLVTLAARLAPTVTMPRTGTGAVGR